jgi:hypothetical protein
MVAYLLVVLFGAPWTWWTTIGMANNRHEIVVEISFWKILVGMVAIRNGRDTVETAIKLKKTPFSPGYWSLAWLLPVPS